MRRAGIFLLMLALLLASLPGAQAGGQGAKGYLALTFDDGPSGPVTQALLDGLEARGINATFFVCGYRMEQYPEVLQRMAEDGHELGLHSFCHTYMQHMTMPEAMEDLSECMQQMTELTGLTPKLFRPPGGLYSDALLQAAGALDLSVILWSVDPCDWDKSKSGQVLPFLLASAGAGDIVLMHDLSDASVRAALSFVDAMQARGYAFCTVSELAALSGAPLCPGERYSCFRR